MRILGIDPGTSVVGWGVVDYSRRKLSSVSFGCILTVSSSSFPEKLIEISQEINRIIFKYRPSAVSIEEPFFAKNAKVSLKIGEVVGAVMLTAMNTGAEVFVYGVNEIKSAVVGYGKADKGQVQEMVKILLNLDEIPKPDDAADALAAAICHQQAGGGLQTRKISR